MPPIISAQGVHKTFRNGNIEVHALRGVNLNVNAGEMIAVYNTPRKLVHRLKGIRAIQRSKKRRQYSAKYKVEVAYCGRFVGQF